MSETLQVRVLAFGSAADVLGWREQDMQLPSEARIADLLEALGPALADTRQKLRFAINEQYANEDAVLSPGDEVALIPPIAGGDVEAIVCRLVHTAIDVPQLQQEVSLPTCGGNNTFVGSVRSETNEQGQILVGLEYSAYEPMALREMQALCSEVAAEFSLQRVRLVHRLGKLALQDAAVAIVTAAPHRAASFDGCRAIIEQLKQRVPIFKKELWGDGGHSWVEPTQS